MRRTVSMLLLICMVFALTACGTAKPTETDIKDWTRSGYFIDENENMLTVTWMGDVDEPGWYVGIMIGETMAGWTLPQEGSALHGNLNAWDENAEPLIVTVSEDGEAGLLLTFEGGESYHFKPYDIPEATIVVTVNTEGLGNIEYAEGEESPEIVSEYPMQSAYIGLAEPAMHTFAAWPHAGSLFVKWTKNGEDFSTEPVITVLLDESAEYIAVFEEDPDWQNPVMNFIGEYQCDRAHASVECFGSEEAWITIEWGSSAWEYTRWIIVGRLDTETLTIEYSGGSKSIVTVDDSGEETAEDEYIDGSGTITFNDDGTFTWHEDQSEYGADMVFVWVPVAPAGSPEAVRQDGERYEGVITLEGIEQAVPYEHIVNMTAGFEMDYDYETFVRQNDPDRECFILRWDDLENPEYYLEVTYSLKDAETVAATISEELSKDYELTMGSLELDHAGNCIWIDASEVKGGGYTADQLQMVYIIPADDSCRIATAHYGTDSADLFGARFRAMVNTLSVIDR